MRKNTMEEIPGLLLIERDRESRSYYNLAFNATQKYGVNIAASTEEALEIMDSAKKGEIDFVILNANIGEMPYYVYLQKLRAHIATFQARVILLSNDISPEDEFILKELGVKRILKPKIEAYILIAQVNEELNELNRIENGIESLVYDFEFFLKSGNIQKCAEIMENDKVKSFMENSQEFIYLIGEYHISKDDPKLTCEILNEYLQKNRGNKEKSETVNILNCLAKALCLCGRHRDASIIYKTMADRSPKNFNHKINLGGTHLARGEWNEATSILNDVLAIDPYNKEALIGSAQAQIGLGNNMEASTLLDKIAGTVDYHTISSFFNNRGVASTHEGEYAKAVDFYKNALFFTKKHSGKIFFNLGLALYKSNKIEEAKEVFNKISETDDSEYLNGSKSILKKIQQETGK